MLKRKLKLLSVFLVLALAAGWTILAIERLEGRNLTINNVDFNNLKEGTYFGEYDGGMLKMRAKKVMVTVTSGNVTDIQLLKPELTRQNKYHPSELFNRVINAQSLEVDVTSGATVTHKAFLKSLEIALSKAKNSD
ncbi:FMN-binding protein [Candidatus Contubernalis alkaliaceticus]|uniref:FMN-binding protein n=1 Tax=Candidatus Contubernalis alkaliaceticus TaxID=338645 RepID=UPI001F4C2477|nr:FMN-binding protein [Candidatus Contubernalis alkalaceticus]UNC92166.1 FMN-binding protein [Candidatus Contubernalis alkalaceticus]